MTLKPLFASAAALPFVLGAALAQTTSNPAAIDDILISSDGPATLIAFPESQNFTNGFRIICAEDPLYDIGRARGKIFVALFNHARGELETDHANDQAHPQTAQDKEIGTTSTGFIDTGNRLIPTYNGKERMDATAYMLNQPTLPGSNTRDPALARALQNHAEKYCLSMF